MCIHVIRPDNVAQRGADLLYIMESVSLLDMVVADALSSLLDDIIAAAQVQLALPLHTSES